MNICIYGASGKDVADVYFEKTKELAEKLGRIGHNLVFGGGNTGMMLAAAEGFHNAGAKVTGVAPGFFNKPGVLYPEADEMIMPEDMRARKRIMEDKSDVFIAAPGGIGTLDELFEIMTLRQLGQHSKPIIIFNPEGIYDKLLDFFRELEDKNFIRKDSAKKFKKADVILRDVDVLFNVCNTVDEVVDYISSM